MSQSETVPVINVAPYLTGGEDHKHAVARALAAACTDPGFFCITGHGIDENLIARTRHAGADLFARPLDQKQQILRDADRTGRGYYPVAAPARKAGRERVSSPTRRAPCSAYCGRRASGLRQKRRRRWTPCRTPSGNSTLRLRNDRMWHLESCSEARHAPVKARPSAMIGGPNSEIAPGRTIVR